MEIRARSRAAEMMMCVPGRQRSTKGSRPSRSARCCIRGAFVERDNGSRPRETRTRARVSFLMMCVCACALWDETRVSTAGL